jgi:hypothetical protein
MAKTNPTDHGLSDPSSPAEEDAKSQGTVLALILTEYRGPIAIAEIVRELSSGSEDFAARDAAERAVRDLVGVGLLHRQGIFVLPTRAALRFEQIQAVG